MLDFEEYSSGHQGLRANNYYSAVNVCPSPTTMDMLLSASDSLSFQEMLDLDIKSEIDTVLGGHNDFASFNFTDLPPLDIDDNPSDLNMWFTSNSNHSNSNFNIDFIGSEAAAIMVNPNSVMPLALVTVPAKSEKAAPKPFSSALKEVKPETKKSDFEAKAVAKTIKISSPNVRSVVRDQKSVLNMKGGFQKTQISVGNGGFNGHVRVLSHGRKQHFNNNRHLNHLDDDTVYPKPAYSYSCLIAMALKNSRTGSLPVSEIYNFMCEHFPYFKTAPNGWKNSVRHNLSLNKCFEKIEKPAVSGAQRKGCLWAMNPEKISKMDEEVQKWSRKDPTAIRKAMINPEHLESLERGELKYNCRTDLDAEDGYGDSSADTEEDEDTSDVEVEDRTELDEIEYVDINAASEEECGFDIEVADTMYESTGQIKIEMELVNDDDDNDDDDELLSYNKVIPSKKRTRSILEIDEDFTNRIYQLHTPSRRKTAYFIKNE